MLALGALRASGGLYRPDVEVLDDVVRLPFEAIARFLDRDLGAITEDADARDAVDLAGPYIPAVRLLLEGFYLAPVVVYLRLRLQGDSEVLRARGARPGAGTS